MAQEIYHRSEWGNPNEQWGNVYLNADLTNELYKRASEYENSWVTDQLLNGVGTKPSIILTPTAYEDGVLNSVKPNKTFGSELVTPTDSTSNWINARGNSTLSVVGGKIRATITSGTTFGVSTAISTVIGKTYSIKSDGFKSNTNGNFLIRVSNVAGLSPAFYEETSSNSQTISTNGTFVATATTTYVGLLATLQTVGDYIETGNVSVKEVTDADFDFTRGSSATRVNEKGLIEDVQILSGELVQNGDFEEIGSELVTNGNFDTDSDWSKGIGWSIENGSANGDAVFGNLVQTGLPFVVESFYKVTYEVKNYVNGNVKFQFTGGTAIDGTTRNANGVYTEYVKAQTGNINFRFRGTNFTGSIDNVSVKEVGQNWVVTDGWSIENGKANIDTSEGTGNFNQLGVLTVGKKYRLSLSAAMTVGRVKFQSDAAGVFIFSSGVSSHEFIASSTSVSFRRFDATTSGYIDNVSVVEITDDTDLPRINYTNFDYENGVVVPYSGEGSLLLEPQSTNLLTYSEDFSNASWSKTNGGTADVAAVTGDYAISPDGTQNASRVVFNLNGGTTINDYSRIRQLNVLATTPTLSLFVKSNNTNTYQLNLSYGGGDVGLVTANPNEWSRVEVQTTASGSFDYRLELRGGITNDDTADVLIWGAQAEALSYATSYIPTNGSTVTRLADVCNNSGNSDLINSTEGVLYAEISALADDLTFRSISINANDTRDDQVMIRYRINSNVISFFIRDGGSVTLNKNVIVQDITEYNKVALKYKNGDISGWINGVEYITSTATGIPSGLSKIGFQLEDPNVDPFFGNVKCVAVFKEALSDTELQKLTTI